VTPGCSPSSANEQVLFEAFMAIHASTSSSILMRFGVLNCVDIVRLSPNTIIVVLAARGSADGTVLGAEAALASVGGGLSSLLCSIRVGPSAPPPGRSLEGGSEEVATRCTR
jgi:hypothetical protein